MKIINNYQVCNGCKYSSLHYCSKFNQICLSIRLNNERYQLVCDNCKIEDSYIFGLSPKASNNDSLDANFRVPGLKNLKFIKPLITMRQYYPEVFYPNRKITAIYDAFPGTIWNGRQANFQDKNYSIEELTALRDELENLGISLNLTWNNHLIEGLDIYDKFCNIITEIFHTGHHSITVASLDLLDYLQQNYPNYIYYQSVISKESDGMKFSKRSAKYDMYVWNRKLNNNWEALLSIPQDERKNIELLCNDTCTPFCNRMYHYNLDNKLILSRSNPDDYVSNYCTIDHDFSNFNNSKWPITINPNDIDTYLHYGFYNFKLCSRGDLSEIMILKTLQYLVKQDYILDAFSWSMNETTTTEAIYQKLKRRYKNDN